MFTGNQQARRKKNRLKEVVAVKYGYGLHNDVNNMNSLRKELAKKYTLLLFIT